MTMSDALHHEGEYQVEADGQDLLIAYNYDSFVPEKYERWMRFNESPVLGRPAPSFPLWQLDGTETSLSEVWSKYLYTVVEFGSFT